MSLNSAMYDTCNLGSTIFNQVQVYFTFSFFCGLFTIPLIIKSSRTHSLTQISICCLAKGMFRDAPQSNQNTCSSAPTAFNPCKSLHPYPLRKLLHVSYEHKEIVQLEAPQWIVA